MKACYMSVLKQMFCSPSWVPAMALDGLGALRTEHKLSGIVDFRVLSLEEGTTDLEEVVSKVAL